MSSLHQNRLLVEGPEPVKGPRVTLTTTSRNAGRTTGDKVTSTVPAQRQGKLQRSGATPKTTAAAPSSTASAARSARGTTGRTGASAAGALTAKAKVAATATAAAPSRAATAGRAATTAKVPVRTARRTTGKHAAPAVKATASAAPAAKATVSEKAAPNHAAKPAVTRATAKPTANPTAKPAAKAATAKPTAKPAAQPTETTTEKPAAAVTAVRPTPFRRLPEAADASAVAPAAAPGTPDLPADEVVAAVAEGRGSRFSRRRLLSGRRRPSLYLAAALVGAISVSGFGASEATATPTDTMSHSVSVAQELGIASGPSTAISNTDAAQRLGELAVSRNARGAEQAAAAQVQSAADQAATAAAIEAARPKAILPVAGGRLTSTFGMRWGTLHAGIDLAAPMRTPEMAAMDGVVLEAGPASGFGLAVYIQHENGDVTLYGHMDQILVQAGQVVKAGDTIALLGQRGQSTGPHLHFEVHVGGLDGQKIDPLPWLRERGVAI